MQANFLRFFAACAMFLPLCSPAYPAGSTPPITKIESRTLPADVVAQQVFSQLARKMRLDPWPKGLPKPKLPLWDMQFWTVPRSTDVARLCESDFVTVRFEFAGPKRGPNTKMRAAGLESYKTFHFLSEPQSRRDVDDKEDARTGKMCAKLSPEKFFRAKEPEDAWEGATALQKAIRAAQRDMPPLSCKHEGDTVESCLNLVAKLDMAKLTDVWPCHEDPAGNCRTVWTEPGLSLTIFVSNSGDVVRVDLADIVTVGDPRAD